MPKMTKAQHAKHEALRAKLELATAKVYAAGPNRDTPFSGCLALASDATKQAYELARFNLDEFERQMIADCRAYRATFGMFTPYWR